MVEIARAVFHKASVVIMDEPTSSLTPNEIKKLFDVIENLKNDNIAILYVTHKIDEIFEIADEVTVFRDGKHISNRKITDTSEEILINDMVGRKVEASFKRPELKNHNKVMSVKNISTKTKLKNKIVNGESLAYFAKQLNFNYYNLYISSD